MAKQRHKDNDLQDTTQKTQDWKTRTQLKPERKYVMFLYLCGISVVRMNTHTEKNSLLLWTLIFTLLEIPISLALILNKES